MQQGLQVLVIAIGHSLALTLSSYIYTKTITCLIVRRLFDSLTDFFINRFQMKLPIPIVMNFVIDNPLRTLTFL